MTFSIRDLFWVTVVVALAVGLVGGVQAKYGKTIREVGHKT